MPTSSSSHSSARWPGDPVPDVPWVNCAGLDLAMSLEAAAGKNPVSHVGKIYNVLATRVAGALVSAVPEITEAHCLIVSQIGSPVSRPALIHLRLATQDGIPLEQLRSRIEDLVADQFGRIPKLVGGLVAGTIDVF
ncbi:MAG: methionine adenosyltransferase [Isosphaeraceae bacterium]